jgi:hypothetical protein
MNRWLSRLHNQSGRFEEENDFWTPPEIEVRIFQPAAQLQYRLPYPDYYLLITRCSRSMFNAIFIYRKEDAFYFAWFQASVAM